MRASKALRQRAESNREAAEMNRIQTVVNATNQPVPAGFYATSGTSATERIGHRANYLPYEGRPIIGFSA